jgi:hypothetical protein
LNDNHLHPNYSQSRSLINWGSGQNRAWFLEPSPRRLNQFFADDAVPPPLAHILVRKKEEILFLALYFVERTADY